VFVAALILKSVISRTFWRFGMKIRRRKSKKRYLGGKNVYQYEHLSVGIPVKFHETVEPFVGKDLDMNVKTEGKSKIVIVLKPRENVSANRNTP
jgi:hypothetical protein